MSTKFRLNWFFGPNLSKKGISSLKRKKWTSPLHIRISLGTTFQVKLTILIFFWPNLPKKGSYGRKQENCTCACVHGCYLLYYFICSSRQFKYNYCILSYSSSYNLTLPISRVLIGQHFIFGSLTSPTCSRWGRKLGFQLSHRQPLYTKMIIFFILSLNR